MCDTVPDCQLEEDERYCTALTTTDYIAVDSEGDPLPQHEGILLFRDQRGIWKPICVTALPASLASKICRYMGFNPDSFRLVSSDSFQIGPVVPEARSEGNCQHVRVSCEEERCGVRPLYRNLPSSQSVPAGGPGSWPWQATFFLEGELKCGGSVVDRSFIMTELDCAKLLVAGGSSRFITVLVGQDRKTEVGLGPHSQLSRVVRLQVTAGSTVVLAQLETPLTFTEHVNKLCLATYDSSFTSCFISGSDASSYTRTVSTSVRWCEDQLCLNPDLEEKEEEDVLWSGVLVCESPAPSSLFQAVAVFSRPTTAAPLMTDLAGLLALLNTAGPAPDITDQCRGFRWEHSALSEGNFYCFFFLMGLLDDWSCLGAGWEPASVRTECVTDSGTAWRGRRSSTAVTSRPPPCPCVPASPRTRTTVSVLPPAGGVTTTSVWARLTGATESLSAGTLLTSRPSAPPVSAGSPSLSLTASVTESRTVRTLLTSSLRPVAVLKAAGGVTTRASTARLTRRTEVGLGCFFTARFIFFRFCLLTCRINRSHLIVVIAAGLCIDESEVCDGYNDCPSGADEVATQCIALSSSQDITQDVFLSPLSSIEGSLRVRSTFQLNKALILIAPAGANLWCLVQLLHTSLELRGCHGYLSSSRLPGE